MKFDIYSASQKKLLLVAHRGVAGGNIPCNTIAAYNQALKQGADMIEIDIESSADGELFIFHPNMEPRHLGISKRLPEMTSAEIKELRYLNYDRTPTQFGIETLDDVLEEFRGRCYINFDKFWGNPERIYRAIARHGVIPQAVVKSEPDEKVFSVLENIAPELAYMPIVKHTHPLHFRLLKSNINYIGAEVIFTDESDEVASPEFIERMHRDKKVVWVNSIIYDHKAQLSAGHSDDTAICKSADDGWGWLAKRGFDLIQTDWTRELSLYLMENGLLYRNNCDK